MNHDSEKWLDDRISEDVDRMADKRIKELMESEELKDIEATMDQLQSCVMVWEVLRRGSLPVLRL